VKRHCVSVLTAAVACASGAGEVALEPNATLRFDFPDLPDTLMSAASGERHPAVLTARLPENYSHEGEFGLMVFLGGGAGGRGTDPSEARAIAGPRDFVAVSMPLFKRSLDKKEPYGGVMVSMDDFDIISAAYGPMLSRLLKAVPNIRPERSAMGGFSNGAHAAAVMLAGQDGFVLSHFRLFYFVDGGMGPLAANVFQKTPMKRCRLLMLCGEKPVGDPDREFCILTTRGLAWAAQDCHVDLTTVMMRGHGHEFPDSYRKLVGQWVRGEKLPESDTMTTSATRLSPSAAQAGGSEKK
jgi:hypothetical protein